MTDERAGDVGDLYTEIATVADAPDDERLARARDLIRRVADLAAAERVQWRDALRRVVPAISRTDFDAIVHDERRARAAKAKDAAAQKLAHQRERAVERGSLLPSPADPMAVARVLAERITATDGVPHTTWWRGDFYRWSGARWAIQQDATIRRWLYLQTEGAVYDAGEDIRRWAPTGGKIANLAEAFGSAVLARPWDDDDVKCVAVANGVLDTRSRTLRPHTPRRFNLAALPFGYDPRAGCPQWLEFLAQVLPGDDQARTFLGEWFGYVVSGRTDQQKMANLFGPRRSGKGTIARVLEALLGSDAVAAPSLGSLAGTFGEQPLIGKSLAVLSDVNWGTRDVAEAVEVLKKISGEDSRDVQRKNREAWHGKLGVRFMIVGNDAPKFTDASGALAGRMIHVRFTTSFFGREDPGLTGRLLGELPGILNWALDGLDRLTERGRFRVPESSREAEREIMRLTSPVWGFLEDRTILAPNAAPVPLDDLFAAYRRWAEAEEGRSRASTKAVFARDLRSAGNGAIRIERQKVDGVRRQYVYGVAPQQPDGFTPPPQSWLIGGSR